MTLAEILAHIIEGQKQIKALLLTNAKTNEDLINMIEVAQILMEDMESIEKELRELRERVTKLETL